MANAPTDDFDFLKRAALEAASVALEYWGHTVKSERKADGSLVSAADMAVDAAFTARLRSFRPHYGWLSEESADHAARLSARCVWVVDPIDGTRNFLKGGNDWVVAAALVQDGTAVQSVIVNPVREQIFEARLGQGAYLNGARLAVSAQPTLAGARLSVSEALLRRHAAAVGWPAATAVPASSTLYRLALVACGEADATFALTSKWEWDVAAGALLVREAGGQVTDAEGRRLRFNSEGARVHGFIAAGAPLHQILLDRLHADC